MKKVVLFILLLLFNINIVYAKEKVNFSECVDGDTIKIILKNQKEILRLLAVDTPESVHPTKEVEYYAKEASDFTCNAVKNAKTIEIEYDDNSDKKDKYGRLLVWLFIDGELFQQKLIENGYAKTAYLYGEYKYTSSLQNTEKLAKEKKIGIWNETKQKKYNNSNNTIIKEETKNNQESEILNKELNFKELLVLVTILILLAIIKKNKKIKEIIKLIKKIK